MIRVLHLNVAAGIPALHSVAYFVLIQYEFEYGESSTLFLHELGVINSRRRAARLKDRAREAKEKSKGFYSVDPSAV